LGNYLVALKIKGKNTGKFLIDLYSYTVTFTRIHYHSKV